MPMPTPPPIVLPPIPPPLPDIELAMLLGMQPTIVPPIAPIPSAPTGPPPAIAQPHALPSPISDAIDVPPTALQRNEQSLAWFGLPPPGMSGNGGIRPRTPAICADAAAFGAPLKSHVATAGGYAVGCRPPGEVGAPLGAAHVPAAPVVLASQPSLPVLPLLPGELIPRFQPPSFVEPLGQTPGPAPPCSLATCHSEPAPSARESGVRAS